jgi:ABC-type uncharacterized transport system involved in gliding motility auxiliary subunit
MNSRKRCGPFLVGLGLVAANLFVFNWIALDNFGRLDLTRDKLFTLHPATQEMLDELDDLVTMKIFLSEKRFSENQGYSQIPRSIRDMVEEFVARSNGRVKAIFLDPTENEDLERQAESAGIQAIPVQGAERDQMKVFNAFLGIVISYGGKEDEKIPVAYFQNEEYRLELELALAIARLTRRETVTIGVNSITEMPPGLDPQMAAQMGMKPDKYDIDQNYRALKQELERVYEVEKVSVKSAIPDHVQLLVLCNTEGLDDTARYYIDQYLMNGGQLMVLSAGTDVDQQTGMPAARGPENDEFFRHYGFTIEKNLLLDRQALPNPRNPFAPPNYFAPAMLPQNFNAESTLMAGINVFALPLASSVSFNPPEGVRATVLATTSPLAWQQSGFFTLEPTADQANPPENPDEYRIFDTVGLLEGEFTSFFANRAIPEGVATAATEPTATDIMNAMDAHSEGDGHDHGAAGAGTDGAVTTPPANDGNSGGSSSGGGGSGGAAPQDPGAVPAPVTPAPESGDAPVTPPAAAPTFVKAKSSKTRVLVIGSNYFLLPIGSIFTQDSYDANLRLISTLAERMTTGSKLSDLRNRTVQRPSIRGDLSGPTQSAIKWFGILGMPVLVAIFGIASWMLRKSRRPVAA